MYFDISFHAFKNYDFMCFINLVGQVNIHVVNTQVIAIGSLHCQYVCKESKFNMVEASLSLSTSHVSLRLTASLFHIGDSQSRGLTVSLAHSLALSYLRTSHILDSNTQVPNIEETKAKYLVMTSFVL